MSVHPRSELAKQWKRKREEETPYEEAPIAPSHARAQLLSRIYRFLNTYQMYLPPNYHQRMHALETRLMFVAQQTFPDGWDPRDKTLHIGEDFLVLWRNGVVRHERIPSERLVWAKQHLREGIRQAFGESGMPLGYHSFAVNQMLIDIAEETFPYH